MFRKLLLCLTAALFMTTGSLAAEEQSYLMATGTTGGTYYPVGVALGTLTKVKLKPTHGLSISAINSAGSAENIRLLREGGAGQAEANECDERVANRSCRCHLPACYELNVSAE